MPGARLQRKQTERERADHQNCTSRAKSPHRQSKAG
jgi:hypothetical protein